MKKTEADREAEKVYGKQLADLRRRRGFSQAELAKESEVALSYLKELEHGRRLLTTAAVEIVMRLAHVLRVDVETLLKLEDPPKAGK